VTDRESNRTLEEVEDMAIRSITVWLLLISIAFANAQNPPLSQEELARKPPCERLLEGADAERVADLTQRSEAAIAEVKVEEAIRLQDELVSLRNALQGEDHWEAVRERIVQNTLRTLDSASWRDWVSAVDVEREGQELAKQGAFAEAESLFQKALDIRIRVLGENHPDTATGYNNVAFALNGQSRSREALPLYEKALAIYQSTLGDDHPETADCYNNLAHNLVAMGRLQEAQARYEKAMDSYLRALGENNLSITYIYNNLAYLLDTLGNSAEASSLLRKALEIRLHILGESDPNTAVSLRNLAASLSMQGRLAEAQPLEQKALDICRLIHGEVHPDTAIGYTSLADTLGVQGRLVESEPLHRKALEIRMQLYGEQHADTSESFNNLAANLAKQGRFEEALPLHEKAIDIGVKVMGEGHPMLAIYYNNMGSCLGNMGRDAESQLQYEKSLETFERNVGQNHPKYAQTLNNLAILLNQRGESVEAESLLRRALDIHLQSYGEGHHATASSYFNLAMQLQGQGKTAEAADVAKRAVFSFEASRLNRATGIERAPGDQFNPRLLLSVIDHEAAPMEAWRQVEWSLARGLLDQQASPTPSLTEQELEVVAEWNDQLEKLQPQIQRLVILRQRSAEEEAELKELAGKRRELGLRLSELAVLASGRQVATSKEIQSSIEPEAGILLWVDIESGKANVQEHFACVVRHEGDPFWIRLPGSGDQGAWNQRDAGLPVELVKALSSKGPPGSRTGVIEQLRRQRIEPVLDYLKQHGITKLYVVGVHEMAGVPVEALAPEFAISYIPSGTFLARLPEKSRYESQFFAVGDPIYERNIGKQIELTALPEHGLLVQSTAENGAASQVGIRAGDVLLQYGDVQLESLDQMKPAVQQAANAGMKMASVKFWRVDEENRSSEQIVSLPVGPLGVLLALDPAPVAIPKLREIDALLANVRGGDTWKNLPGTRYEVGRISQLFAESKVLLEDKANERAIEEMRISGELAKYRYLHFATHGKGDNASAFESKLVLSQDGEKDEFAKPGEPWMNNEISAREVLDYWKINADLVTLSSCESGLGGQGSGDGLLGFSQAFLLSGARTVCLSLWSVDDTATALLMNRFYENLLGKRSELRAPMAKIDALREAKEWLRTLSGQEAMKATESLTGGVARGDRGEIVIQERFKADAPDTKPFADPHYWSAFILIGDPE
jgi:CHAT domain-containing protein/tetratricopeptide (TPR) repeat protein